MLNIIVDSRWTKKDDRVGEKVGQHFVVSEVEMIPQSIILTLVYSNLKMVLHPSHKLYTLLKKNNNYWVD